MFQVIRKILGLNMNIKGTSVRDNYVVRNNSVVLDSNPGIGIFRLLLIVGFFLQNFQSFQEIIKTIVFFYSINGNSVSEHVPVRNNAVILSSNPRCGIFKGLLLIVVLTCSSPICPIFLRALSFEYAINM